jgi:hypothetical protein
MPAAAQAQRLASDKSCFAAAKENSCTGKIIVSPNPANHGVTGLGLQPSSVVGLFEKRVAN